MISADKNHPETVLAQGPRRADPRLKLALAWLVVVLTGSLSGGPLYLMAGAGAGAACLCLKASPRLAPLVKAGLKFWLFWLLAKAGLDWLGPGFSGAAWLDFSLKLFVYLNAGFSLALSCTPLELAWAGCWFLRPLLGQRRAGRLALGVALMPHMAFLLLESAKKIKLTLAQRAPETGWFKKTILLAGAIIISQQNQLPGLALALAGRRPDLDRYFTSRLKR